MASDWWQSVPDNVFLDLRDPAQIKGPGWIGKDEYAGNRTQHLGKRRHGQLGATLVYGKASLDKDRGCLRRINKKCGAPSRD